MRLTVIAIALFLTGCGSLVPVAMQHDAKMPSTEAKSIESLKKVEGWNEIPVISEGKASVVLMTPESLPLSIRDKKITMELDPGATITDVVAILGKLGVPIIVANQEVAKKDFFLPRYTGTVGGLLAAVTKATDVWFTWHGSAVVAAASERIGVAVPQESNFAETLGKSLDALGIKEKAIAWQAGMAVMEITPSQFRKVKTFLERYTANAAVISLQIAVVNVSLNQSAKTGIDWSALQLSATGGGGAGALKDWASYNASSTNQATNGATQVVNGVNTVITPGTTAAAAAALPTSSVAAIALAGGALTSSIFGNHFSFSGMFNFLQTYGNAETKQNVMLKTVAGTKVEFKSLTSVPYVSSVGVSGYGVTGASTGVNNQNTMNNLGSTKTEKADDGITVELTPSYDSSANSVTVDMKLSIKAVVAMNELSAGNQIGKLTQPTTAERSFTDTLRLRPGQTVVVGGLTYDTYSNNKGAPIFLTGSNWESNNLQVNRQTMFIVVRPTVLKLGQILVQETGEDSMELLPPGRTESAKK